MRHGPAARATGCAYGWVRALAEEDIYYPGAPYGLTATHQDQVNRDLLAEVYAWFTEGFDTADLQEAKTLMEDLA